PHIWRWRDWIIESLNADAGYDEMVIAMLAADEAAPEDPRALRATGFLARSYKLLSREQWLQEAVDHTTKAFLGVTLECARCHDHRYDPIPQEEYYRVRAIFHPYDIRVDRVPGVPNTTKDGILRVYDRVLDVYTFVFDRGDDRKPLRDREVTPGVPRALGGPAFEVEAIDLPLGAHTPDRREFVIEETIAASLTAVERARAGLETALADPMATDDGKRLAELELEALEAAHAALEGAIRIERIEEQGDRESDAWREAALELTGLQRSARLSGAKRDVLARRMDLERAEKELAASNEPLENAADDESRKRAQEAHKKATTALDEAKKAFAAANEALAEATKLFELPPSTEYEPRKLATHPKQSTGRRLAFARWIASRENPLAARVAVNHIWGRRFGRALVESVFDFGRNGTGASHPDLLDWLAAELMEPDAARPWSLKHIHRLLLTSSTYRMSSAGDPRHAERDPDNRYLWRFPSRRIEAELVRDAVLHVTAGLDLAMGGPEIAHEKGGSVPRRSLYFQHAPEKTMTMLRIFDAASPTECYRRKESIVPQQALALANSDLSWRRARALAREIHAAAGDVEGFVTAAFEHVLARSPTTIETKTCAEFLESQLRLLERHRERLAEVTEDRSDLSRPAADLALRSRESLVHVLLNHHEFVTLR
ncbi:MAG TPA: DUF1553 domain-containing protein, partial [Planctomycetota bacterium]|nr:DUF1553 domain-containing protein [Planctomycetota bacterium]